MGNITTQATTLKTHPPTYRKLLVEQIIRCVRAGDSCSLIGVSGMAKSNLFRHLLTLETQQHFLGNALPNYLFLAADSHALSELSERAAYELLSERLLVECERQLIDQEVIDYVAQVDQCIQQSADPAACRRVFGHAVRAVLGSDPDLHLVCLFDQFDEVYRSFNPHFFVHLRALRDEYKYRVSYLVFTREELPRICSGTGREEFYELFSANVMGLGPYDREDSLQLLARVASRYGESLSVQASERLIGLTGGHPGLLKSTCLAQVKGKVILPESDDQAITALLQVDDVRTECGKLWDGLGEDERTALRDLVINRQIASRNAEAGRRLQLKHLVKEENRIARPFCTLFAEYIAAQKATTAYPTKIQAGPIRIDAAGEVWVSGQQIAPPLTKKELLLLEYLCLEPGRLRTRDEIVAVVYPDEYKQGNSPTDDALNAMIKRLRIRLEQSGLPSHCIATLRGKGYRLEIN